MVHFHRHEREDMRSRRFIQRTLQQLDTRKIHHVDPESYLPRSTPTSTGVPSMVRASLAAACSAAVISSPAQIGVAEENAAP